MYIYIYNMYIYNVQHVYVDTHTQERTLGDSLRCKAHKRDNNFTKDTSCLLLQKRKRSLLTSHLSSFVSSLSSRLCVCVCVFMRVCVCLCVYVCVWCVYGGNDRRQMKRYA